MVVVVTEFLVFVVVMEWQWLLGNSWCLWLLWSAWWQWLLGNLVVCVCYGVPDGSGC